MFLHWHHRPAVGRPRTGGSMRIVSPFTALLLAAALACSAAQCAPGGSKSAEVNVFIGTGGDGHTFPGATRPFGMIQLSPDTQLRHFRQSYPWAAGYRYEDGSILGFSHTHFSGAGHSDLGDVLLMPTSGELKLEPGYPEEPGSGQGLRRPRSIQRQAACAQLLAPRGHPGRWGTRVHDAGDAEP
jgi:hypothetical protein